MEVRSPFRPFAHPIPLLVIYEHERPPTQRVIPLILSPLALTPVTFGSVVFATVFYCLCNN